MITAVLVFFVRDDTLLLCRKARSFGKGYMNGVGGKCEPGETLEETVVRECQEEISMTPLTFHKVAHNQFIFSEQDSSVNWDGHVYFCTEWEGKPVESDELVEPQWTAFADVPYEQMWADDIYWLPHVLDGQFVDSKFWFGDSHDVIMYDVNVSELPALQ